MARTANTVQKMSTVTAKNIADCLNHLRQVIANKSFLNNEGLNNEVPFHICPFDPSITSDIYQLIKQLKNELKDKGISALEVNIYDLVIEILREEGDWDWIIENEGSMVRTQLKEELQGILDTESVLIPAIKKKMSGSDFNVLLLSGVGEVFPYIRAHNILNNLQKVAKGQPTLMFFPGSYQHSAAGGASLVLFGRLQDDKYYRAFNILDRVNWVADNRS